MTPSPTLDLRIFRASGNWSCKNDTDSRTSSGAVLWFNPTRRISNRRNLLSFQTQGLSISPGLLSDGLSETLRDTVDIAKETCPP